MGEIIKHDFSANSRIPKEKAIINDKDIPEEEYKFWIKFIKFMISDEAEKLKHLKVSPTVFEESKKIVKNYTDEELFSWFEDHGESDWKAKPSFYRAVYEELKIRLPYHPKKDI